MEFPPATYATNDLHSPDEPVRGSHVGKKFHQVGAWTSTTHLNEQSLPKKKEKRKKKKKTV